jgi:hypothetical protein
MLRHILTLLLLALRLTAGAVEPALIGVGETWAFLPATNEPPAGWREPGFDDAEWRHGDSGFGSSNRGENTPFHGLVRGSGTIYFRKEFRLEDPAEVAALVLRADWQGGFVAYLNGSEVVRRSLGAPGSPLTFTNRSEWRPAGWAEDIVLTNFASHLRPGTNVLAVQVHPPERPGFDLVFVPELLANFHRGPYAQNHAPGVLSILWRTPLAGPATLEFGVTPELGRTVPGGVMTNYSLATIEGLPPGSRCYYRVRVAGLAGDTISPTYEFRMPAAEGPATVLLIGDSGSGARAQFEVGRQLERLAGEADAFIHLGDIVYPWLHPAQTDTRCLSVYRDIFQSVPSFMTWGNHDLIFGSSHFQAAFRMPTNNVPALEHLQDKTQPDFYYSFDVGDAHFAVMYWPWNYLYVMKSDSPQARWLEADLAASAKRWKFICLHHPVNTSSSHRFDDYDLDRVPDRLQVEAALLPIAARQGVRLIFSGHDHAYERFQPTQRVTTVVSGGGGTSLYGLVEKDTNSASFYPRWHLSRLDIQSDTLRLTAVGADGKPLDALEFRDTPADSADPDGDGLGTLAEELTGSDPQKPDTDGDGLPDGWEFLRGLDPAKPMVTPSADGVTGPGDPRWLAEFLAEPIPRPRTELRVHNLDGVRMQLRWLGVVGFRLLVESSPAPDSGFQPIEGLSPGGLAEDRQALELKMEPLARYFRVRLIAE